MDTSLPKKGQLESEISKSITQWEKEYLGRGPIQVKTDIVRNMIIVHLKGILTPAERELTKTETGMLSIKKIRADLVETGNEQLKEIIYQSTGEPVESFYTDISTRNAERIIVFMLKENLEKKLVE
ncbi:hypothetical protein BKP37_10665 [Anaerobacillus alkalilacustris]|uniref:Na+-translocating membrane potential-generating system MpsC domain-containing protein n=1 Tax=Anaerobacillus alkalilacustris TaxID=393763 RepID=A0A1S2LP48_9BACI|nr:DUF2294 domain-containing protein [Anaerobacillus alkalilacustris]OIJ13427.1 hypothetical protein BKP37_10665 [Anaerobacillus alkalilacustris]